MSTSIELTINTRMVSERVRMACERVVSHTVTELEAATKARIVGVGAVDTGHMLGSVSSEAHGLDGQVKVGANYALFVHDGYHLVAWGNDTHRWIPGRPFLRGPVDEARPAFYAALQRAVS